MAILVNRGSRSVEADPEYYRLREERRELRAEYRRTHRHVGWICPFCHHQQILVYSLQHHLPGEPLATLPRWIVQGAIETRCDNIVRTKDGAVVADCGLLCRVALIASTGNAAEAEWVRWSQARWEHEALQDRREAIADGYRADPKTWERGAGLLVPRFAVEPPPFVKLDALNGQFGVTPLEARESSTMSIVTLWLPHGHIKVPVVTDYTEDGVHYVELNIPLPYQSMLRQDLLVLIDAEHRAEHDNANRNVYLRSPYGTGPYCWTGRLESSTVAAEEVIVEEEPAMQRQQIPEEIPVEQATDKPAPVDTIGGDSWFDLDDDVTADAPWSAVDEYLRSHK